MSLEEKSLVGSNPEIIRPYLVALFKALDDAGITWAVMRGWERLPEWTRYDVDILVASSDLKRTYKIAELLGREHGFALMRVVLVRFVWILWIIPHFNGGGRMILLDA